MKLLNITVRVLNFSPMKLQHIQIVRWLICKKNNIVWPLKILINVLRFSQTISKRSTVEVKLICLQINQSLQLETFSTFQSVVLKTRASTKVLKSVAKSQRNCKRKKIRRLKSKSRKVLKGLLLLSQKVMRRITTLKIVLQFKRMMLLLRKIFQTQ